MRRIHFYQADKSKIMLIVILLAAASVLVGTFELIPFPNPKVNQYLNVIGFLVIAIYNSRIFWHKDYVEWNGRCVHIRIKSFFGKSVRFEEVSKVALENNQLAIAKTNGGQLLVNMAGIDHADAQKLLELFRGKSHLL